VSEAAAPAQARGRYPAIDVLRGGAIVLMVLYHAAWDAHFFAFLPDAVFANPAWKYFRFVILSSFLLLVGVSLVLAHSRSFDGMKFGRRLALVVVCAALISAYSRFAFPDQLIFFGVLHCIAIASVIGLAFRKAPWWVALAAGAVITGLSAVSIPAFNTRWLGWIGFMPHPPDSRDYVPLIPWAGVVLVGMAAGKLVFERGEAPGWLRARTAAAPGTWLAWGGRNSLAVYMVHQPVLFGLFMAAAALAGAQVGGVTQIGSSVGGPRFAEDFLKSCRPNCVASGLAAGVCEPYCSCMLDVMRTKFSAAELMDLAKLQRSEKLRRHARDCRLKAEASQRPAGSGGSSSGGSTSGGSGSGGSTGQ
jgi:uncharacterized membrane protein